MNLIKSRAKKGKPYLLRKGTAYLLGISLLSTGPMAPAAGGGTGGVSTVTLTLGQPIEAPRWMFDSKARVKGGVLITQMVQAKRALADKNRSKCLAALAKAYSLGKSLGPWITLNQLQCAVLKDAPKKQKGSKTLIEGKVSVHAIQAAVHRVEAQPNWLLYGPAASPLKSAYTAALLAMAQEQVKSDRRTAWSTLDKISQMRQWLNADERASLYRWAGELAFIEQNLSAAQDFFLRSLNERENSELRTKMDAIRTTLLGKAKTPAKSGSSSGTTAATTVPGVPAAGVKIPVPTPAPRNNDDLGISDEEREIYTRMNRSYEAQDYISSIEDAIELIQKYPGSRRASDAGDRVLDIYLSLVNKTDEKFRHVKEAAVKEMQKADAARMHRWANNAYSRGAYLDALTLAEKAYTKYDGLPEATKVLLLAGKAALSCGEYEDARKDFEKLIQKHGGTSEAAEASFRLGLLELRLKHYAPAAAAFERLLALSQGRDFEYRALYWQWRAQQKIDAAKSSVFAEPLIAKYPLTYYGLRAKAELNGGFIQLPSQPTNIKVDLRMLQSDRLAWERFNILLKAGWFQEAERELASLPDPQSNEERIIRAKYWAATFRYDLAIGLLNKAFDDNPSLLQTSVLQIVFPQEFANYVAKESRSSGIAPEWILSIIRQESSYRPEAKSPASASGVMQLMTATAQEIAHDLKMRDFTAESLLDPEVNIRLGAVYFSRLVRNFNGNYPLALAAYNAGPTRLRRWLNSRKDLSPLDGPPSSVAESELWIDEMPWDETSHYVKSILRNWMLYKIIDGSKLSLSEPIWVDEKGRAR